MPYKKTINYHIGNLGFKTKKESYQYCKKIIDTIGVDIQSETPYVFIPPSHGDYDYLTNLIKNHEHYEEKIGSGVQGFIIKKNFVGHNELNIKRTDGTTESISWNHCSYFKKEKYQNDLRDAMREAINLSCYEFKQIQIEKENGFCVFCGDTDDLQTDHHAPSFMELKYVFLEQNKKTPETFAKRAGTHKICFTDQDWIFEKRWIEFHDTNCNLQILCGDCNRRKKKK